MIMLALMTMPFISSAQKGWVFGMDGGLNFSWVNIRVLTGNPLTGDLGTRLTYRAGLFAEYDLNRHIGLQLGLYIENRGFTYKENEDNMELDIRIKAPYLEVPLIFRYTFLAREKFGLYALAGPSFAYLIGGRIKGERKVNETVYTINDKVTDSHSKTDIGIKTGLGVEFPFPGNTGATFFDIRYNYGLTDHIRQAGYYNNSNLDANSHVISVVVGVRGFRND